MGYLGRFICWLRDCEEKAVAWSSDWVMKECQRCKERYMESDEQDN